MRTIRIGILVSLITALSVIAGDKVSATGPTALFLRGYSVIPTPQKVELGEGDIKFDESWVLDGSKISKDHIAVRSLLGGSSFVSAHRNAHCFIKPG